ncbi:MAG: hypothetical protein E7406_05550 [Ruminococcaceae bacterium]|nr:hypothetical protein [Oscillospiraceae bacterium]
MLKETDTKIKNAIFKARTDENGKILSYRIFPAEGYKLHEITLDEADVETGEVNLGFTESYITAGAGYDFEKNEREIYVTEVETDERSN